MANQTNRYLQVSALALLACATGLAAAVAATDETQLPAAVKAIQGTWVTAETDSIEAKWTFEGEKLKASVNGMEYTCKVKLDDKAKPHATADLDITDGPEDSKGKTSKAIYKLESEKLVLCVAMPGLERPKNFEPVPDEVFLFELKKQKKD